MELFRFICALLLFAFALWISYCAGYSNAEEDTQSFYFEQNEKDAIEETTLKNELKFAYAKIERLEKELSKVEVSKEKLDEIEQLGELFNYQGSRKREDKK